MPAARRSARAGRRGARRGRRLLGMAPWVLLALWALWGSRQGMAGLSGWKHLLALWTASSAAQGLSPHPVRAIGQHGAVLAGAFLLGVAFLRGGAPIRRLFPLPGSTRWERRALDLLLGFAVLGSLLFGLALTGLFYRPLILAAAACGVLCPGARGAAGRRRPRSPRGRLPWWAWPALGPCALTLGLALVPSTYIDVYNDHLFVPELFLKVHRFSAIGATPGIHYPFIAEMTYAYGVIAGRDALPHFIQLTVFAAAVVLLAGWATRLAGPEAGWLAAAGILSFGLFEEHALLAKNMLAAAAFPAAGAVCALRGLAASGGAGWLAMAAACFGCGAAVKLSGVPLLAVGGVGVAIALGLRRAAPRRRLFAGWAACAVLPLAPWVVKAWLVSGDPFWPVGSPWLRGALWDPESTQAAALLRDGRSIARTAATLVPAGARFWWSSHPLVACLIPVVVFAGRRLPEAVRWAGVAAAASWALLWWLIPFEAVRLAFPAWILWIGVTAVAGAGVLRRLGRGAGQVARACVVLGAWLPLGAAIVDRVEVRSAVGYLAGGLDQSAYLREVLPTYREAGEALERLRGRRGVLVLGDERLYGLPGRAQGGRFPGRNWGWEQARECASAARIAVRARQANLSHVLYNFLSDSYPQAWLSPYRWDDRMIAVWRDFVESRLALVVPAAHTDSRVGGYGVYRLRPRPADRPPEWLPYLPGLQGPYYDVTHAMMMGDLRTARIAALQLVARVPRVDYVLDLAATVAYREQAWEEAWRLFQPGLAHGTIDDGNLLHAGVAGVLAGHADLGFPLLERAEAIDPSLREHIGDTRQRLRAYLGAERAR